MIAEIGHFCLILAFLIAIAQGIVPIWGAHRGDPALMRMGQPAAYLQLALVAVSFAALTYAYVVSDFSVRNVAANSHTLKPMLYKVTGVWGNHEGSILLWILVLALFGAAIARFGRGLPGPFRARVLSVQAWVTIGFFSFSL